MGEETKALDVQSLQDDEAAVSGCFEFHLRTRSFDLHQTPSRHKHFLLAHILRSKSDGNVKSRSQPTSPTQSPHASPCPPGRRRFVRVVRDSTDVDLENPHVVHKFSSEFLSNLQKSSSTESNSSSSCPPYTVTGHTILKRQPPIGAVGWTTIDQVPESSPTMKHASFRDEVEVMEYDRKEKIRRGPLAKHKVKLHDDTLPGSGEEDEADGGEYETSGHSEENDSGKAAELLELSSENSNIGSLHPHIFTQLAPSSDFLVSKVDKGNVAVPCGTEESPDAKTSSASGENGSGDVSKISGDRKNFSVDTQDCSVHT